MAISSLPVRKLPSNGRLSKVRTLRQDLADDMLDPCIERREGSPQLSRERMWTQRRFEGTTGWVFIAGMSVVSVMTLFFLVIMLKVRGGQRPGATATTTTGATTSATHTSTRTTTSATTATITTTSPRPESFVAVHNGARFRPGMTLGLYAVGSSNTVFLTWLDELHLLLKRLGFVLPLVPALVDALDRPSLAPICDDYAELARTQTSRIGKPGWGSWGFAYDGMDDCGPTGFRIIGGIPVSCVASWRCAKSKHYEWPLRVSQIAADAARSNITVLSCWMNDSLQYMSGNACYNFSKVSRSDTAVISIENLRRIIRSIHRRNPHVLVVVLGIYPAVNAPPLYTVNESSVPLTDEINKRVRDALVWEPRTVFASYRFPPNVVVFQQKNPAHPNCRGSKIMANAIVDALFSAGELQHGLVASSSSCQTGAINKPCNTLPGKTCCMRSSVCILDQYGACLPYGPGT